jgi:hypothetical protein
MRVDVPNEWLTGLVDLRDANDRVVKLLSSKNVKHIPRGHVFDRLYEEELYIFE